MFLKIQTIKKLCLLIVSTKKALGVFLQASFSQNHRKLGLVGTDGDHPAQICSTPHVNQTNQSNQIKPSFRQVGNGLGRASLSLRPCRLSTKLLGYFYYKFCSITGLMVTKSMLTAPSHLVLHTLGNLGIFAPSPSKADQPVFSRVFLLALLEDRRNIFCFPFFGSLSWSP